MAPKLRIASVFILLGLLGCSSNRETKKTLILDIAISPESCGDGREIVVIAVGSGKAKINSDAAVSLDQLVVHIRELLRYRAERLVYVTAEAGVHWGDFIDLVEHVAPEAHVVSIITPAVAQLVRQRSCLEPSCRGCENFRPLR